jgi:hypothetical protein
MLRCCVSFYAECCIFYCYAECHVFIVMLIVLTLCDRMLSVLMLSVLILSVLVLSVLMLSVIMLSVVMLRVMAPPRHVNGATTLSLSIFRITTVSIMKHSMTIKYTTLIIKDSQHKRPSEKQYRVPLWSVIMSVAFLSFCWVSLCKMSSRWMSLSWMSWCHLTISISHSFLFLFVIFL